MKFLLVEPFFAGSHQSWANGYQQNSQQEVAILSLKGHHWKWRMYGGAVKLASVFNEETIKPDLIIASDMLDLTTFLALTRFKTSDIPCALYFHENQLTYPWSPNDKDTQKGRDHHYAFLNYTSALAADQLFFNSQYHLNSFLGELPKFLKLFPDYRQISNVELLRKKSQVLYLGMDLKKFDPFQENKQNEIPILLWNHRWEYDKNPDLFFKTLFQLKEEGLSFQLIILGASFPKSPAIFEQAKAVLNHEILHIGFAESFKKYAQLLWQADILPVTNFQDFFGGSIVEAMYCNCFPLLPKRLAYPEHIPKSSPDHFFYENDEDFYQKLKTTILSFDKKNKVNTIQNFVAPYDWSTLAPQYDLLFSNIVKTHTRI